ncbi:trigger factor [Mycoplasmopsis caviae]|uniref:Trigger factor n=1 Tax=Mycoplasmopsis caviae TaxID=55603 RepID=A0A3P8L7I1_9BACT|nr:trigger factor [Mycoplasmopsis caviae]UUD34957.1 trigger factor [Mycoplasmopsis caviae]VDR42215.1 trigger factor [Mycoplasmopsis caviae]
MIKYVLESKNVEYKDQNWKQIQNNFLMDSIKEGKKISPDQLIHEAFKKDMNIAIKQMGDEITAKYPKALIFSPIVVVEEIDKEKAKATITFVVYPKAELDKFDVNIKPDSKYEPVTKVAVDEVYKKFIAEYPLLKEVDEPIKDNDYVRYDIEVTKDNQVLYSKKDLDTKVATDFLPASLSNELVNHKLNDVFTFESPEKETIKITVNKIFRPFKTQLTNDNIKEIKVAGINSLDDLYKQLSANFKKEMASGYLLNFLKKVFITLSEKYGFDLAPILIDTQVQNFIDDKLATFPPQRAQEIRNAIANKQKDGYEIIDIAKTNVRNSLINSIIEYTLSSLMKNKISDEEIDKFYEIVKEETAFSGPVKLSRENAADILVKQKMALNLLNLNDKDSYQALSNDLGLRI